MIQTTVKKKPKLKLCKDQLARQRKEVLSIGII